MFEIWLTCHMRNVGGRAMLGDPTAQVLAKKIYIERFRISVFLVHIHVLIINLSNLFNVGHL